MVSPAVSPVPCRSTVLPLSGWPTSVVIIGAVGSTSTVRAGDDWALVRFDESVSVAVNVCTLSVKVAVVMMSKLPSARTVPVPTIVLVLLSA